MEPLQSTEFYDRLARAFDVMTDWPARLAFEMPFIQRTLNQHNARSVLDTACGTGWHAIALAQKGYTTAGCDASPAMIERARTNAAQAGVNVRFETADFQRLDLFPGKFDAILCLGNSLPHLLSREELVAAFGQILGRLDHGGVVILHNLNYDLRLKTKPRFFPPAGTRTPWCGALPTMDQSSLPFTPPYSSERIRENRPKLHRGPSRSTVRFSAPGYPETSMTP